MNKYELIYIIDTAVEETARKVEQLRPAVQTRFSVGDMEPLRRSGRLAVIIA